MVELSRPRKKMLQLAKKFEGHQIDFDGADGPQCADLSAFLIKNSTGKTIWGNAIRTGDKDNLDIINESEYTAELIPPSENPEPGDLLVEDTGDDIGHVSLIEKVHSDGTVPRNNKQNDKNWCR
jgi:hypothetical protein